MFKKVYIGILSYMCSMFPLSNNTAQSINYAKVVLVGETSTGKTTLQEFLFNEKEKISAYEHTFDISSQELYLEVKDKPVMCYFWDTPGDDDKNFTKKLVDDFRSNSHVAIVMINSDFLKNKNGLFKSDSSSLGFINDLLLQCPNCKIIFGVIRSFNEKNKLFKNQLANYMDNVLCSGNLKSSVAGWIEIPSIDELNKNSSKVDFKKRLFALIDKAIEMYGIDNLPTSSKDLHGRFEKKIITRREGDYRNVPDGTNCAGNKKTRREYFEKDVVVGEEWELKKW